MVCPVGEHDSTAHELEEIRKYLQLLGRLRVHGPLQAKVDMSGVIQKTLFDAHRRRESWCELPHHRRLAWFRTLFSNHLSDEIRRFRTQARDVTRERSIHQSIEDSASRLNDWLAADVSSPSQRAVRDEDALLLAAAMAELPEDQRTAVEMHHLEELPLAEVARHLDRSREATAMLVYRGIKSLRSQLSNNEDSQS